ncbi:hypothetical protein EYZ11_013272 [Aspergillus tanneri]|uniref:DUF7136 domain-containing protein n=1 Tax=Aspergillus tanneri TaxID=1220188 RepID=A0A4S3IY28_9EURO|nr:uncharacterized protein ATNIH1004_007760 [Aspergillus tanneri]KAA8646333.1 hypothetical protein ATNIH1004_007760 [Aspergillus tanneri]THC87280.1 hypothetical protein EYZ11_013272 [Aspergillus tanneri]
MFNFKAHLVALSLVVALGTADPTGLGFGEVDVVFPRNDTFELMPLMPIVFAVQNPAAIGQVYPTLEYMVSSLDTPSEDKIHWAQLPIRRLPANETTTTFLHDGLANRLNTENMWEFAWTMRWTNCSTSDNGTAFDDDHGLDDQDGFHRRTSSPYQSFIFTTAKGGRQPNLTAISIGDDCGRTQALAFNVTQTLKVPTGPLRGDGVSSCALLASPAPTPRPCKVSVAPEAASSISSTLTHAECYAATPAVSCPPKSDGAAVHGPSAQVAWWTASSAWLIYNIFR